MRPVMGGITRGNTEKVGLSRSDRKESSSSHMGPSRQSNREHLLQIALRMLTYLWKEFFKTQLESAHRPCSFVSYEFRSETIAKRNAFNFTRFHRKISSKLNRSKVVDVLIYFMTIMNY